jgi:hypothetical protein
MCWVENGSACGATLCNGFSLRELYHQPLQPQPPAKIAPVIVIRKEDIPDAGYATRKQQEQKFQRQVLMLALMKEEGQIPPDMAVPSVDELLDQIQRDRASGAPSSPASAPAKIKSVSLPHPTLPKFCTHCGRPYPRVESKFCATCGHLRAH